MKLKAVKITKTTSCLTYALKRVGLEHLGLSDSKNIDEYFYRISIDTLDKIHGFVPNVVKSLI